MDSDRLTTEDLPADVAPQHGSTRQRHGNQYQVAKSFPFGSYDTLPTVGVVLENLGLSLGTLVASTTGFLVTAAIFLPLGLMKSTGNLVSRISGSWRGSTKIAEVAGKKRRCVVIHGASSGIGAALVREYATANTHLVLIARDIQLLNHMKHDAEAAGATASVHSLDFFDSSNLTRLRHLLHELDREYKGIDVAISNIGVTGHRSDVVGDEDTSNENDEDSDIAAETKDAVLPAETGREWGLATAERIVQINITAWQTFTLTCWSLARARRLQDPSGPKPSIVLLSSSAAFFFPANFGLYSASKAYTYSLGQTLRILSMPYGIKVITVAPGFIESGMTHTMLQTGATTPVMQLGSPLKLARRVKQAEESNEGVVLYPFSQAAQLFAARGLNPLMESFGMWVGGATGMASYLLS